MFTIIRLKVGGVVQYNNVGRDTIDRLVLESLADVRQEPYASLQHDMRVCDGDLKITAKEQSAVIAMIEDALECGPLLEPKDLGTGKKQANSCLSPITGTSIQQLGTVVLNKLSSY